MSIDDDNDDGENNANAKPLATSEGHNSSTSCTNCNSYHSTSQSSSTNKLNTSSKSFHQPLHLTLFEAGIASRRESLRIVTSGRITVNGRPIRYFVDGYCGNINSNDSLNNKSDIENCDEPNNGRGRPKPCENGLDQKENEDVDAAVRSMSIQQLRDVITRQRTSISKCHNTKNTDSPQQLNFELDGKPINIQPQQLRYVMIHKPRGVLCSCVKGDHEWVIQSRNIRRKKKLHFKNIGVEGGNVTIDAYDTDNIDSTDGTDVGKFETNGDAGGEGDDADPRNHAGHRDELDDGPPLITSLIPSHITERLGEAGRLDLDSEGLVFMTNHHALIQRLTRPPQPPKPQKPTQPTQPTQPQPVRNTTNTMGIEPAQNMEERKPIRKVDKVYEVTVLGIPNETSLAHLRNGARIGKLGQLLPCKIEFMERLDMNELPVEEGGVEGDIRGYSVFRVVLNEGKKNQIRRMFGSIGHRVVRLIRVSLGPLVLGPLPRGESRELTLEEVEELMQCCHISLN